VSPGPPSVTCSAKSQCSESPASSRCEVAQLAAELAGRLRARLLERVRLHAVAIERLAQRCDRVVERLAPHVPVGLRRFLEALEALAREREERLAVAAQCVGGDRRELVAQPPRARACDGVAERIARGERSAQRGQRRPEQAQLVDRLHRTSGVGDTRMDRGCDRSGHARAALRGSVRVVRSAN
jgi:hypothetical protein